MEIWAPRSRSRSAGRSCCGSTRRANWLLEQEVSDRYGVSRVPCREALLTLTADSLVDRLPRRGFRVRQLDASQAEELYELRLAIELFVAEKLARNGGNYEGFDAQFDAWEPGLCERITSP